MAKCSQKSCPIGENTLDESHVFFFDFASLWIRDGAEQRRVWECPRPLAGFPPFCNDGKKSVGALPLDLTFVLFFFLLFNLLFEKMSLEQMASPQMPFAITKNIRKKLLEQKLLEQKLLEQKLLGQKLLEQKPSQILCYQK